MSAQFIITYGGAGVRFGPGAIIGNVVFCDEYLADRFISEADAWMAAHRAGLNPQRCRVVNLYERNQDKLAVDSRPQPQHQ